MLLSDFIKVAADGEPIEAFDIETKYCSNVFDIDSPMCDWHLWEVVSFYSIWNASRHETKTHVEVRRIKNECKEVR